MLFFSNDNLILSSDLAIAGGGVTLYELAATGTPALAFCLAENQLRNIKGMAKVGALIDMGWGNEWRGEKLHREINNLANNYVVREEISGLNQKLIDGKGVWRVSKVIMEKFPKGHWRRK